MASAAVFTFDNCAIFRHNISILHRGCNMPTKFGGGWSKSEEMATVSRNSRWRPPPFWLLVTGLFDKIYAFFIGFAISPPTLVRIGRIVMIWHQFFTFVNVNGGSRHLEFFSTCDFRRDSCVLHQIRKILI